MCVCVSLSLSLLSFVVCLFVYLFVQANRTERKSFDKKSKLLEHVAGWKVGVADNGSRLIM